VSTSRQVVGTQTLTSLVEYVDGRHLCTVLGFDDDFLLHLRRIIRVGLEGHAFFNKLEFELTGLFGDDGSVVGIPFADLVTLLNHHAGVEIEFGSIRDVLRGQDDLGHRFDETQLTVTTDNNLYSLACFVYHINSTQLVDFEQGIIGSDNG